MTTAATVPPALVTHVCRVGTLHDDAGTVGVTAIDKRPVDGAVQVGTYGLRGDVQADRKHHGGPEKALYAIDQAEADHWAAELGTPVTPGRFGENLRLAGLAVDDAEIGERWRIGDVVEVEVTGPRTPCATFGRWLRQESWVRRYTERGRPGAYLRVLAGGPVRAGDAVTVTHRPGHGVTVARWFTDHDPAAAETLHTHEYDTGWEMAAYLRPHVERALRRPASRL
ncbi:MOSC domain-containing protein [Georgenia yuyongxinii]|uniref:MOSC domain-containing protein n=1 Tax=Georgenia yuyongxinii TaxID=2589797 RepID=A0A552WRV2_9MICO|nr:MOSC domain-containing protein [Georgenia yuyongxinii]TRW45435.1 MOSC domain-containing protein [Georgenia yuyongxinii]